MVSKKKYKEAIKIVLQYEKKQEENKFLLEFAEMQFPKGTFVVSKLNRTVRGIVKNYNMWYGKVQLKCENNGKLVKMLVQNAVIV